ncbi:MAG: SUMF1/EgtB/PvdO family nonheme iron enzyme, partial [Candidatus Hydrogenedentes bacterium]|nr:SUMF1/EgtB/PvdO family nonheme iron enzyme [Candidatus Hydrogenedentota bacterium]
VLIILAIVAVTAVCLAAGAIWNVRQRPVRDAQKALAELNAIQRSVDALPTIDPDKYKQAAAARKTATDLMAQHQFQKAAEEYRRAAAIFATILDGPKPTAKQQTPKKPAPPSSKSSGSTEKPQATISQTAVPPRLRMAIRRTTALHDRALEINADKVVPDMLKQAETLLTAAEQSRNQKNFEEAQTGYDNAVKLLAKIVAETEAARNAPEGMAYVPSGQFVMGSAKGGPNERPESSVNLSGFYIDTYEVSVNDFKKFLLDTNRPMPAAWRANPSLVAQPNLPACGVTWNDALDYTLWIGKRLPTEAEWEKAARGTDGLVYPWGNSWEKGMANASGVIFDEYPGFAPVTGLLWSKSPYGCCNMAGNAIEWVSSLYKPYPYNARDGRENLYVQGPRVLRGGSCRTEPPKATLRTTSRFSADPRDTRMLPAFRCAKNAVLPAMLKPVRSTQQKPTGFKPISTKTRS